MFDNFKDAQKALEEYRVMGNFNYYLSKLSTKEWRDSL